MDQPVLILIFVVLVWIVIFRRLRAAQRHGATGDSMKRLARLEAKVDLLMKHAGITYDPHANVPPGVLDALQRRPKDRSDQTVSAGDRR